jgi:hypothetical protein
MAEQEDALEACCQRLMRNDDSLTKVTVPIFQPKYLESYSLYLPQSIFVTSVNFDITSNNDAPCCNLDPMLAYLSETSLLQSVGITHVYQSSTYALPQKCTSAAYRLMRAIAGNAHMALVQFSCHCVPLGARNLPHLLDLLQNKASSLCHLRLLGMSKYSTDPWSESQAATFAATIASLSLLQSLTLEPFPTPHLVARTLQQLRSHACLRKLSIRDCFEVGVYRYTTESRRLRNHEAIVHAVSGMLQSRVPLEVLELSGTCFSLADMKSLVQGLETSESLVELSLEGIMLEEVQQELVRFLRAGRSAAARVIRRLCLRDVGLPDNLLSILTAPDSERQPTTTTIGTSLRALNLESLFLDIDELLNVLVAGKHHLLSLSLGGLIDPCWSQVTQCLPNLVHLQELHLKRCMTRERPLSVDFVRAMRQNGSLHQVSEKFYGHESLCNAAELQQIAIYCQRNQMTRQLLQNLFLPNDDTDDDNAKTSLSLLPKLFHVMKPAKRIVPNSIFLGLLACSGGGGRESCWIGPRGHGKRLGPSIADHHG